MMKRFGTGMLVATLSIGLAATACKKAKTDGATGSGSAAAGSGSAAAPAGSGSAAAPAGSGSAAGSAATMTPEAAGSGTAQAAGSIPQSTGDDLSLLPVKSELVMGINFQQMQSSALWKQFVEPQIMKNMDKLEQFKTKCGFNPLEKVQSISMGLSNLGPNMKPEGAMVVHGLEKAKMAECLEKMKDEMKADGQEFTKDGDVILIDNTKAGMKSAMTFVNDTTMLMAIGGDKAKLLELAKGDTALKSSAQFVDMFGKINATHTVWGLMNGSSKLFAPLAGMNIKFKAVYGSVNVTDGLQVEGRARMDSADQATNLATMINTKLGAQAKAMSDKFEVGTDDKDVKASVMVSAEKLKTLMGLMMGGGMGGGGMGGP